MSDTERHHRDYYTFWGTEYVRHGDTDSFGHANNAYFVTYFETGRVQCLQELCEKIGDEKKHPTAIVTLNVNFMKELLQGEKIDIGVRVGKIGNSSFEIISALFVGNVCHATSTCTMVYFDTEKRQSTPIPDGIRNGLIELQ